MKGMETVVGAIIALVGSFGGALVLDWLSGRRSERQARVLRVHRLSGLLAEIRENLLATPARLRAPFASDVWEDAKADLEVLPIDIAQKVRDAYVLVRSHNATVVYEREKINYGGGHMDGELKQSMQRVIDAMNQALPDLEKEVKKMAGTA